MRVYRCIFPWPRWLLSAVGWMSGSPLAPSTSRRAAPGRGHPAVCTAVSGAVSAVMRMAVWWEAPVDAAQLQLRGTWRKLRVDQAPRHRSCTQEGEICLKGPGIGRGLGSVKVRTSTQAPPGGGPQARRNALPFGFSVWGLGLQRAGRLCLQLYRVWGLDGFRWVEMGLDGFRWVWGPKTDLETNAL